jgi:hypothetical protein
VKIITSPLLTRPPRNPRRAYDADGNEIEPETLAGMRSHGVRHVWATCTTMGCGHEARVNVDALPDDLPVPDIALRLRCSKCGRRSVATQPDWSESGSQPTIEQMLGKPRGMS